MLIKLLYAAVMCLKNFNDLIASGICHKGMVVHHKAVAW